MIDSRKVNKKTLVSDDVVDADDSFGGMRSTSGAP